MWAGSVPNEVGMRCFHPMDLGLGARVPPYCRLALTSPGMEDSEGSNRAVSHSREERKERRKDKIRRKRGKW